jgi:hypothetical protein
LPNFSAFKEIYKRFPELAASPQPKTPLKSTFQPQPGKQQRDQVVVEEEKSLYSLVSKDRQEKL